MLLLTDIASVERRIAQLSGDDRVKLGFARASGAAFGALVDAGLPVGAAESPGADLRSSPAPCIVPQPALERLIAHACTANGTDPALVKAVVANESGFDASATSSVGAQGLMQLMPSTAASVGVSNSYDPRQNIAGGTRYLGELLQRFGGNVPLAVAAYNAGPGAVERGEIGAETRNYVHSVLESYAQYRSVEAGNVSGSREQVRNGP